MFHTKAVVVGTPRAASPRRSGAELALLGATDSCNGTKYSAAERGGDGAARHPYLCVAASQ